MNLVWRYNRTYVELKSNIHRPDAPISLSYNRTYVELKYALAEVQHIAAAL